MIILGTLILSGIIGAAAFLQAGLKGWSRLLIVLTATALAAVSLATTYFIAPETYSDPQQLLQGPDELKYFALSALFMASSILFAGAVLGAILGIWLLPGKAGVMAFLLVFVLLGFGWLVLLIVVAAVIFSWFILPGGVWARILSYLKKRRSLT